jgi:pimeloyl-ACP methyl ester carboxylesterase
MTPLLLIPGFMCDARMWGDLPALLHPREARHCLPTQADTVQALAAHVLADAPPRFALAGLSMGGIVAMEVLAQAPSRVTRLALLDTNPRAELPSMQANRARQTARALSGDLAGVMRDEMKPNYLYPGHDRAEVLDLCMDMALSLGPEVFARQSRALSGRPDQTATLAAFKGPALVLMGEGDRLCPRDRHDLMHALMPQSRLAIISNAGHLPTLEQPALTAAELSCWLAQPE